MEVPAVASLVACNVWQSQSLPAHMRVIESGASPSAIPFSLCGELCLIDARPYALAVLGTRD